MRKLPAVSEMEHITSKEFGENMDAILERVAKEDVALIIDHADKSYVLCPARWFEVPELTQLEVMACNNQEENRGGMNAHISERTLREIYLKGYEIAIRKARPQAIMTGHNLVNGVNAAESRDLLIAASREEWGFDGLVMTDWGTTTKAGQKTKYGPSDCDSCIRAGTDLIMPGSKEDLREIISAVQSGRLSRRDLRWSAWNILRVMQRLYQEVC